MEHLDHSRNQCYKTLNKDVPQTRRHFIGSTMQDFWELAVGAAGSGDASWQVKAYSLSIDYQRECQRVDTEVELTFSCAFGAPASDGSFDVILIGDSHSEAWRRGMDAVFQEQGISGLNLGSDGTPPFVKTTAYDGWREIKSSREINHVYEYIERHRPRLVVLAARWDLYYLTTRPRGEYGTKKYLTTATMTERNPATSQRVFEDRAADSFEILEQIGVPFLVVGPTPHNGKDPIDCLLKPRYLLPDRTLEDCRDLTREVFDEVRLREGKLVAVKPRAEYVPLFAYSIWKEKVSVGGKRSP